MRLAQRDPQWRHVAIDVTPARAGLSTPLHQQFGGPLSLLMAIVGGVLLLACANIGGLLLARGAARQHEMAVRVSLGAGRLRMVRQVLTESLLLASIGGALGLVGARFGATILMRIMISGTQSLGPPPRLEIPLDARVLTFTIGVTVLAALVFGLAPAIAAFVSAPASALRQGGGAQTKSRRVFGNGLVVAQVAISLALLSVSQLYIGHLRHLRDRSLGFDRDRVLLMSVNTSRAQNREQLAALYRDVVAAPAGDSRRATRSRRAARRRCQRGAGSAFLRAEGFDEPAHDRRRVSLNTGVAELFPTYGTPLLAGRDFRDADMDQPRRIIVNQALARHYFPGRDPIGRHVWLENQRDPYEIVGVAGDAKYNDVRLPSPPTVYLFAADVQRVERSLAADGAAVRAGLADDARRLVNDVFGTDSVGRVTTLAEQVDAAHRSRAVAGDPGGILRRGRRAAGGDWSVRVARLHRRTPNEGDRHSYGSRRHPRSREPHGGDERGLVGQRGIPSWRADGVLEYTIRRAQRRESSGWRGGAHCLGCGGPDRSGVHRGLRPHAPRHTRRAGHRTTRGIG